MIVFEIPPELKALLQLPREFPEVIIRPEIDIKIQPKGRIIDKLSIDYWGFPLWAWLAGGYVAAHFILRRK